MHKDNRLADYIRSATLVERQELKSVMLSFGFVFILMAAYYMLRPVRDALASDWTNTEISILWNIQALLSCAVVIAFGAAASHLRFRHLVQFVYIFFAVSFMVLHFGSGLIEDPVLVNKGFYLWVSLFSLFHVSVFWSFMADLFNREQAGRLFAFIAVGASAGALAGPLIAALVVRFLGSESLVLVASLLLLIPVPMVFYLQHLKQSELQNQDVSVDLADYKIGGSALAGFRDFVTSPYLIGIAGFILLYTAIGSFAYFEQTNLLRGYQLDRRTEILAWLALVVNILTFVLGFFATSRLVTRFGMPVTLAVMPVFMCLALLVLALAPILTVLLALQVFRQAGNYGVTRPAREMLFTAVSRESRFKAKPVVDVAMYRGGDALWGVSFAALTDGLGLNLAAMGAIGAAIAALWALVGIYLGRAFRRKQVSPESTSKAGGETLDNRVQTV
ncbi:MAG: MFS transporter [Gammaproteobacteria bacterium]|nr:MFS transporter [Pseudomonadales bacterium]MCP5345608.1 MFS transporter [Pseudomonadales bacterium]